MNQSMPPKRVGEGLEYESNGSGEAGYGKCVVLLVWLLRLMVMGVHASLVYHS